MNYSDFDLIQMRASVLFTTDKNDRLLGINESDADQSAPRFFLARSAVGNIWRFRYDLPQDVIAELEHLAASEPIVDDWRQPPRYQEQYRELLRRHAPLTDLHSGPAYWLPELDPPSGTVTITPENRFLLEENFPYTLSTLNERMPVVVVVENDTAIVACFTARVTTHVCEAGVYAQETCRGRGYGAETVRGWSAAVRATGRIPLYSTSWDNIASQALARKLGAVQYGVDFSIT